MKALFQPLDRLCTTGFLLITVALSGCRGTSTPEAVLITALDAIQKKDLATFRSVLAEDALQEFGDLAGTGLKFLSHEMHGRTLQIQEVVLLNTRHLKTGDREHIYSAKVTSAPSGSLLHSSFKEATVSCVSSAPRSHRESHTPPPNCLILNLSAAAPESPPQTADPSPRQTVTLLTSLDLNQTGFRGVGRKFKTYNDELEVSFRAHFERLGYRVVVKHLANQFDLASALRSPESVAVFWLSHAGAGTSAVGVSSGAIVDSHGFDVSAAFASTHPNLRFLAIVGCNSQGVINAKKFPASLALKVFDKKIDAKLGLTEAMRASKATLNLPGIRTGFESACETRLGFPVEMTRNLSAELRDKLFHALRVENNGKVLGYFPAGKPGDSQSETLYLDLDATGAAQYSASASSLKLVADVGSNPVMPLDEISVGSLTISTPWPGAHWKTFSRPDGAPMGVTKNILIYDGIDQIQAAPVPYQPFACRPLPAIGPAMEPAPQQ